MKLISQGAEAQIFVEGKKAIKKRINKSYRIKQIDESLRSFRTKRETKVISKLQKINFPVPALISSDKNKIEMEFIEGKKLRDILDGNNCVKYCEEIGKSIATMHSIGIIHGDLTTSNMIIKDRIYFIDFGLSFFSQKIEDKAVDLHLLRQALESKHHTIWKKCFSAALKGYKKQEPNAAATLARLEKVEARGRNKFKG